MQYHIVRNVLSDDEIIRRHEARQLSEEINRFLSRVRLPLSGLVASLYSRLDAWRAARVERRAQVCFERGWV